MIESLIVSLTLAITIELGISLIIGIKKRNDIITVISTNTLTNPIFVFFVNILKIVNINYYLWILLILTKEIIIIFAEGKIYSKVLLFNKVSGLKMSLINNIISFAIGLIFIVISQIY